MLRISNVHSEHGFATHFVPSRRIPALLERLAALDSPTYAHIDNIIEEAYSEREPGEPLSPLVGELRIVLDSVFHHDSVEGIIEDLKKISDSHGLAEVQEWAANTLMALELRSPTSLKVALLAIRKGKGLSLLEALQMEMNFATAFCVSISLLSRFNSVHPAHTFTIEWRNTRLQHRRYVRRNQKAARTPGMVSKLLS